ncbi:Elongation factor 1-alpha, partial [ANME-1 cluster archaeon GoMg1]|nr:Elongation factor 1-alpha [ANME-1 cluster archaeon GoMg1]
EYVLLCLRHYPVFSIHHQHRRIGLRCPGNHVLHEIPVTGAVVEENPDFIKAGDAAIVTIKPTRPLVIERVKEIPQLGRFAIRDMGQTVAAGMVIDVKPR